jgi:hypothetical protein
MADKGANLVDLTQTWDDAKTINGDAANFTDPASAAPKGPDVHGDGKGGYNNSNGEPTDKNGNRIDKDGNPVDPPPPTMGDFIVQLDMIHRANDAILHETKNQIFLFEAFRDEVVRDESWMFITDDPQKLIPYHHKKKGAAKPETERGLTGNRDSGTWADVKDPNPENTAEVIASQHDLLQAVGSSIHLIGTFSGLLNDAGQMYAGADRASWAEEPK